LKLTYDKLLSNFGFNCNLRHYTKYQMAENQLPAASLTTMLDVLEIEHAAVFNVVVDTVGIERVVLVADEVQVRHRLLQVQTAAS